MKRVIEVRTYKLKEGSGLSFHELMSQQSLPLLRAAGTEVLALGPSLHGSDAYYLIRAYDSVKELQRSQANFYNSAAWRHGPREQVLALIESYWDAVIPVSSEAIEALTQSQMPEKEL